MSKGNGSFHYATEAIQQTYADYTFGSIALFSFAVGMPGSIMTFGYFMIKQRNLSSIQYMMISGVDTIITFLFLFNGISEFNNGYPMMFRHRWFCISWAFLWQACVRLSIFLVATLSISRTISLVYPFYKIKRRAILIPIAFYALLVLGQQLLPIFAGKSFWYARRLSMCTWLLTDVLDIKTMEFKVLHFCFVTLEYVIPAFPIISSCIVTICLLTRQRQFKVHSTRKNLKVEATKTIIYLTVAYIFFNTPLIVACILETIMLMSDLRFQIQSFGIPPSTLDFIYTLIGCHMVALNSTTNVVIYFCRKRGLRKLWWSVLTCNWVEVRQESIQLTMSQRRTQMYRRTQTEEVAHVWNLKDNSCVLSEPLNLLRKEDAVLV